MQTQAEPITGMRPDPYAELAIRAHVSLLTIGDVIRYASNPDQRHLIPGALARHDKANAAMQELADQADPRITHALSLGLESTRNVPDTEEAMQSALGSLSC